MHHTKRGLAAVAASFVVHAFAAQSPQIPLPGSAIPQFVEPLPQLSVAGGTLQTIFGNQPLKLSMCEFKSNILPTGTIAPGQRPETWVWGYIPGSTCPATTQDTYLGPVIVSARGTPTAITFLNNLGAASTTNVLAYRYGTDQTLHWADPLGYEANMCAMHSHLPPAFGSMCAQNHAGPIAAVPHLHGGEVPPELDGGPDAWFTSDGLFFGHAYYTGDGLPGNKAVYAYPNTQEAAPLWFHDHTLGATRLNVYAGLAGGYLLVDPALNLPANLPGPAEIVPLIIQDRKFDTNGQLYFPAGAAVAPNAEHPYWSPEFLGDAIVVNGKAWPFMSVEPRRYRFLVLNGSNARAYELFLTNPVTKVDGPSIWVIGTDGGYLDAPVKLDPSLKQKLVIMPGERYEILIDFAGQPAGTTLVVRNTAKAPFPDGATVAGSTLGRVLQFRVTCPAAGCPADASYDPASGAPLRQGSQQLVRLASAGAVAAGVNVALTRQLTLNEVMMMPMTHIDPVTGVLTAYPGGPYEVLVNNTKWSGESPRPYNDFTAITVNGITTAYTELPKEGDTEVWELVNLTADAHPIHLHLVQFQVVSRQAFDFKAYDAAYNLAFPMVPGDATCTGGVYCPAFGPPLDYYAGNARAVGGNPDVVPFLKGPAKPALPQEAGWKDTVIAYPGEVTRLAVRWAPTDLPVNAGASALHFPFDPNGGGQHGYVWHCHIIDHEDNEMMRPDAVQLNPLAPSPSLRALVKGVNY